MTTQTTDEHLDPKNWTKDSIIDHLFAEHGGTYFTTRSTKRGQIEHHRWCHQQQQESTVTETTPPDGDDEVTAARKLREYKAYATEYSAYLAAGDFTRPAPVLGGRS